MEIVEGNREEAFGTECPIPNGIPEEELALIIAHHYGWDESHNPLVSAIHDAVFDVEQFELGNMPAHEVGPVLRKLKTETERIIGRTLGERIDGQ